MVNIPSKLKESIQPSEFKRLYNFVIYNLEKVEFVLLTPPPVSLEGGGGQNICYHVAPFVIPFSLICNMTMLCES